MATMVVQKMRPAFDLGVSPRILNLREAASKTFLKGAVVTLTGGYIDESGTDPTAICGIAAEDGHNYSAVGDGNTCPVYIAEPGTVFVANVCSGSGTDVTAITDVGKTYGIYKDTNNNWCIDKGDTANSRVIIENYVRNPDTIGDTSGRLYFRFMGKFCQLHITS